MVDPVSAGMGEEIEFQEKEWELEMLQKIKEEEEQRMAEDDELLFYEVVVWGIHARRVLYVLEWIQHAFERRFVYDGLIHF